MADADDAPPNQLLLGPTNAQAGGRPEVARLSAETKKFGGELTWTIVVALLPLLADFLFRSGGSSLSGMINFSVVAYSGFALAATSVARSMQHGRQIVSAILITAAIAQIILAVLETESQATEFQWWILAICGIVTIVGTIFAWLPDRLNGRH